MSIKFTPIINQREMIAFSKFKFYLPECATIWQWKCNNFTWYV